MPEAAIRLDALTKYYGRVVGVEQLSLEVLPGEVFGFLGANGAGKTTTIRMLLDLLRPSSGSASILGYDCHRQSFETRRRIGYVPGEMPIYPELTGEAYLAFLARLGPAMPARSRVEALQRRFNVSDLDLKRRMRDYSHGMKRKLGLIQALMHDPPVLILDEPTSGLDPLMIEAFTQTIDELARDGRTTIFLSSHIMSEVERMCARIALMRNGRMAAVRTIDELRAAAPRRVAVLFSTPVCPPAALDGVHVVTHEPQQWVIEVEGPLGPLMQALAPLPVADVRVSAFTLDETILRLMSEAES